MNVQGCQLGALLTPRKEKVKPRHFPTLPYVGLEHVEAHSTRLLGTGDASEMRSSANRFYAGDVLYSRLRPYLNKVWRADRDGLCSSEFIVLPGNDAVDSDFLCYRLNALDFVVFANGLDAGDRPRVKFDQISSFIFPPFSLAAQRRIVSKLDELFSRIADGEQALARVQKLVERYRQSMLKAAVTGELTREWREKRKAAGEPVESGAALLERILAARRAAWEQVELAKFAAKGKTPTNDAWKQKYQEPGDVVTDCVGDLPSGWQRVRVDAVGEVQLGRQRAPAHHTGNYMRPYLRVANVFEECIDTTDVMSMNFTPDEFVIYALKDGDILLNEGQSKELVGRPAIYRSELPGSCFTNTLVRFRATQAVLPEFALIVFLHYMKSGHFQNIAKITTNIAHLGAARFAEMSFPVPPMDEQREIVRQVNMQSMAIAQFLSDVSSRRKYVDGLRQSILKSAFSGQLVPQDPNDEPASVLLERIAAECGASRSLDPSPARGEGGKAKRGRERKDARHPRA